ncbi:hypothetical protein BT69DRAFT_116214 [Atractiella rhizophila]|nr:hypothetical protein BT69DRAFT_116214 [Atractiella rhizophila]
MTSSKQKRDERFLLPAEIIDQIFEDYVDDLQADANVVSPWCVIKEEFLPLTLMCKAWIAPVRRFAFRTVFVHLDDESSVEYLPLFALVRGLQTHEWLNELITHFELVVDPRTLSEASLIPLKACLSRLRVTKHLVVDAKGQPLVPPMPLYFLDAFEGLRLASFSFKNGPMLPMHKLTSLSNSQTTLQTLVLHNATVLPTGTNNFNSNLREIELVYHSEVPHSMLKAFLLRATSLRTLRLSAGISHLPHKLVLAHIVTLDLSLHTYSRKDLSAHVLIEACPNLQSLSITDIGWCDRAGWDGTIFDILPRTIRVLSFNVALYHKDVLTPSLLRRVFIDCLIQANYLPALNSLKISVRDFDSPRPRPWHPWDKEEGSVQRELEKARVWKII